jgi:hypothetical protein
MNAPTRAYRNPDGTLAMPVIERFRHLIRTEPAFATAQEGLRNALNAIEATAPALARQTAAGALSSAVRHTLLHARNALMEYSELPATEIAMFDSVGMRRRGGRALRAAIPGALLPADGRRWLARAREVANAAAFRENELRQGEVAQTGHEAGKQSTGSSSITKSAITTQVRR